MVLFFVLSSTISQGKYYQLFIRLMNVLLGVNSDENEFAFLLIFFKMFFLHLQEAGIGVPADISFKSQVFDMSFHPSKDIIAAGEIEGNVTV